MAMHDYFEIDPRLETLAEQAEKNCSSFFSRTDRIARHNAAKVLHAFTKNKVSETCFTLSTGYGYGDFGRETLDRVWADVFGTEDALVRHNFVSGTHALSVALFGLLRPEDELVFVTGTPYDTLHEVIGLSGKSGNGSLKDFGIKTKIIPLTPEGKPNIPEIQKNLSGAKMAYIQRSRGYSLRTAFTIDELKNLCSSIREVNPKIIIFVDNCYGEFVEEVEPSAVGADILVGSMIKNPGGGIARTGGYIAGNANLVELCAYRLTCVGLGKEVGCTLGMNRELFQGLYLAPDIVANALKTTAFAAELFTLLGFSCSPEANAVKGDIVTAIELNSPENVIAFCQGIQKGSPVDAYVTPEPWDMPGYENQVIMAAGAFTNGASIELSADAPLRPPYAVWLQGGISWNSGRISILLAAQELLRKKLISL